MFFGERCVVKCTPCEGVSPLPGLIGSGQQIVSIRNNKINTSRPSGQKKGPQQKRRGQPQRLKSRPLEHSQTFRAPLAKNKRVRKSSISLSKCALKYALAIAEPFHPNSRGACLPSFPAIPTFKCTGFSRFTVTSGTQGLAFCAISPGLANNEPIAFFSTALYAQTTVEILSAANTVNTGVSTGTMTNLPYTSSELIGSWASDSEGVIGRIVSVGVRITYVGTTLNESGVFYIYSSPTHQNVTRIANSTGELGALAETEVCGITRKSCEARAFPVTPGECEFSNSMGIPNKSAAIYPYSSNNTDFNGLSYNQSDLTNAVGSPVIMIVGSGLPTGASFLVEVVQHVEYAGHKAAANVTNSESDQRGFEIVTAASQRLPNMKNAQPEKSFLSLMKEAIGEVATSLKPMAVEALKMGAMSLL